MRLRGELILNKMNMQKINKKGEMSLSQLITIIIIIATTVLVLFLLWKARSTLQGSADGECAAAVAQAAQVNKFYGHEAAIDIKGCNTQTINIKRSDLSGNDQTARTQVKRKLANEMFTCWKAWGKGQYNLFDGTGDYCHPCAIINFDAETQKLFANNDPTLDKKITDFDDFLKTEKLAGVTYQDLLTGYGSPNSGSPSIANDPYNIQTDKPYVVLFWYAKEKDVNDVMNLVLGDDAGARQKTAVAGVTTAATITGIGLAGAMSVTTAGIGAIALGAYYAYVRWGGADDYYTLSATFLTPHDANAYYAQQCMAAAAIPVSP